MIVVKNLTKLVRGEILFSEVNFVLNKNTKAALIGPNGCGKTTLFKLILKETEPDGGTIAIEHERIGYLPQEFIFEPKETVKQYLDNLKIQSDDPKQLGKIMSELFLKLDHPKQLLTSLSEGQKLKIILASILIHKPTLLLLDEPTNHLDLEGILWFESFIQQFKGSVLMISHDRAFLDHTVNQIFEFDEHKLTIFHGNYTDYKSQKETQLHRREIMLKVQEKKRQKLAELITNAHKIKDGKARGKAVRAAEKRMEREITANEIGKYQKYEIHGLHFTGNTHAAKLILRLRDLNHAYGAKLVLENINLELRGNERVWLSGINGAGKTTLLQIITQHLIPTSGEIKLGENMNIGYFRQNQQHLPMQRKVEEYLLDTAGISHSKAISFLGKLSFTKDYLNRKLGNLSPGERARLSLGLFTNQSFNFLILDEPANHLDIVTKEIIEKELHQFSGALLLVSHDRYFVEQVGVNRVLKLDNGILS